MANLWSFAKFAASPYQNFPPYGMLSFSELEFKWSVYVIATRCYPYLNLLLFHLKPMIYLYRGSEKCEKLAMLPQIWLYAY